MIADGAPIGVIGAGLMGHGIAQVFAAARHPVAVFDPVPEAREALPGLVRALCRDLGQDEAIALRVRPCDGVPDAVRDAAFVVEAALEDLALKQRLFAEIEAAAPPDAILASNTSVIPITRIMQGLTRRERALGTHWWNPPALVPLVEVIGTEWTSPETIAATIDLHTRIGKTPVHVKRDVAGFVGNRLQHALWREAIALVEQGVCDAETVDIVVKASFGLRLAVLGPIENADLVGTDLTLAIHRTVLPEIDSRPAPSPLLEALVAEGHLGMKSGQGFRRWTPEEATALRRRLTTHLRRKRD
jgi:3-hydroxybutyryl-CoA dehydrogenase